MRHKLLLGLAVLALGLAGCATDGMEDEGVVQEPDSGGLETPSVEPGGPATDDQGLL